MNIYTDFARVTKELFSEIASIWYVVDSSSTKIIVKVPSNAIKSILQGCKVLLFFSKDYYESNNYIHTGIRIYDDEINYMNIIGTNRFYDENYALRCIMEDSQTAIDFYNELDICVASVVVKLDKSEGDSIIELLGNLDILYVGEFDAKAKASLDNLDYTLDKSRPFKHAKELSVTYITPQFLNWKTINHHFYGTNELYNFNIEGLDDGNLLETQVWASLDYLFGQGLYASPYILKGGMKKELIDVFSFYDKGIFLIEAKALGFNRMVHENAMDKKVKNIKKQIQKALNQIVGANRNITKNVNIYSKDGTKLIFDRSIVPHGIVLVSELFPFDDWNHIIKEMEIKSREHNIMLSVLDLKQLAKYVKQSHGKQFYLDVYLMLHFEAVHKKKSLFVDIEIKEN